MNHDEDDPSALSGRQAGWRRFLTSPAGLALAVVAAGLGVFAWIAHGMHILGVLPLLLPLLLCLGMHALHHRGHGRPGGDRRDRHRR